jgi:hypothetical protein
MQILGVTYTHRNVVLSEDSGELLPCHKMTHRLHGTKSIPPCSSRSQQLLCGKTHLLLIDHREQQKLLL